MLYQENILLGKPVSRIGFGGAAISGEGGGNDLGVIDESSAERLIKEVWDAGINLFDTAPVYGFGLSEERLGKYLPKDAIVVTSGGVDWQSTRRVNICNGPKVIERMLMESLKRLKREFIDIYMIHWPDQNVDIRRPMEVLCRYQEKGVIAHLGLCNTNAEDLKKAQEVGVIGALQSELNVLNTKAFDQLGADWKKYFSMGWGTWDKGILYDQLTAQRTFDREKIERVEKLKTILNDYKITLTGFCLHFNLNFIGIASCLIGLKNNKDLVELSSHLHKNISVDTIKEVYNRWNN